MDPWRRRFWVLLTIGAGIPLVIGLVLAIRFLPDRPVTYARIEEHFKYGSTGGYAASGFPYWIWKALPVVFKDRLPQNGGKGYEAFGMIFEPSHDLPIGMQKGRNMGIDRVFVNCAVCHHSTVRDTPSSLPRVYLGMPAARFDLGAFEQFLFDIATDERFDAHNIVPEIERQAGRLNPLDRYLVYPVAISLMQQRLLVLRNRFEPVHPDRWGPGRVDTFNASKAYFNFPFASLPDRELHGAAEFPSIWNQGKKRGMQLHWDGNNDDVVERNKNAAFGTGTTPSTVDLEAIGRIETWLWNLKPPPYPYPIDKTRAARGATLYKEYCAACHGASGEDFAGEYVGKVTPIAQVATDPYRLDSFTYDVAVSLATPYAGEPYRFRRFRKTYGYANMPLDGLWLRAPYLHNGSVPTLRDLLEPVANRPIRFFRGYDVFDPVKVGFRGDVGEENGRKYFCFETRSCDGKPIPGNGNSGHDGPQFGTRLPAADKDAIVEYLKTF
jgi:Cytochrome C oxidase, cbb3-type, subunit III